MQKYVIVFLFPASVIPPACDLIDLKFFSHFALVRKKKKESITCIGLENTLKKSVCGWQKDRLCLLLWDLFYLFKVLDLLVKLVASVEVLPFGALRFDFAEKFDDLYRWPQFQYEIQWLRLSRLGSELLQLVLKASAVLNRTGAKTKKVFGGS